MLFSQQLSLLCKNQKVHKLFSPDTKYTYLILIRTVVSPPYIDGTQVSLHPDYPIHHQYYKVSVKLNLSSYPLYLRISPKEYTHK